MNFFYSILLELTPVAHAAGGSLNTDPLKNIISSVQDVIDMLVPVIFAIAFIVFIYGVFQYFIAGGADEEKRKTGRTFVLWGVIGFAIMLSVWGLVHLVTDTFNVGTGGNAPDLPHFKKS